MKKTSLIVLASFLILGLNDAKAQTQTQEGNVIISPYIGVPNWSNSFVFNDAVKFVNNNSEDFQNISNEKTVGGSISYGGRIEYMLADNFGLAVDGNYEESGVEFDYARTDTVTQSTSVYHYKYSAKKTRVMARFNFHFVQNERVDAYFGVGAGIRNVNRVSETNEPGYETQTGDELWPVAFRLAMGTQVFFTDNIGMHLELGAGGGGLLQVGLCAKF